MCSFFFLHVFLESCTIAIQIAKSFYLLCLNQNIHPVSTSVPAPFFAFFEKSEKGRWDRGWSGLLNEWVYFLTFASLRKFRELISKREHGLCRDLGVFNALMSDTISVVGQCSSRHVRLDDYPNNLPNFPHMVWVDARNSFWLTYSKACQAWDLNSGQSDY